MSPTLAAARSVPRSFEFARQHFTDPDLGAPQIAAAVGISERYVYVVFRASGAPLGEWIRQERVDAAADMLARPGNASLSIAAVAHRFAFADHAHFTRTLRATRGMTPSEWRRFAVDRHAATRTERVGRHRVLCRVTDDLVAVGHMGRRPSA